MSSDQSVGHFAWAPIGYVNREPVDAIAVVVEYAIIEIQKFADGFLHLGRVGDGLLSPRPTRRSGRENVLQVAGKGGLRREVAADQNKTDSEKENDTDRDGELHGNSDHAIG